MLFQKTTMVMMSEYYSKFSGIKEIKKLQRIVSSSPGGMTARNRWKQYKKIICRSKNNFSDQKQLKIRTNPERHIPPQLEQFSFPLKNFEEYIFAETGYH